VTLARTGDRPIALLCNDAQLASGADERSRADDDTRARPDKRPARWIARVGRVLEAIS